MVLPTRTVQTEHVNEAICAAVKRRVLLSARYRSGEPRLLEPYGHGTNSHGVETLVAYQRTGDSGSGRGEGWKAFAVTELSDLVVLDVSFVPTRDSYVPGRSYNLQDVHCFVRK
jgi:hypothetical protein